MEPGVQVDGRTFRVNFSADGAAMLKHLIDDKLKEFMGDYTDDTLVEYVIVLLRNGRRKEEAKSELDVFLGDDSDSFVSWLWDHLASNLDQYVELANPAPDENLTPKATSSVHVGTSISRCLDSDEKQVEINKTSKSRHNRKWRGLGTNELQPPPLQSCSVDEAGIEGKPCQSVGTTKQSASPNPPAQKKRSRASEHEDEHERPKPTIGAPRRLLQFAVRDAVAMTRPSSSLMDLGAKRLRSEVSAPRSESTQKGLYHRIKPVARVPSTMSAAIRAVAEAAEDVVKPRSTRNVFDRLNHSVAGQESTEDLSLFRDCATKVDQYEDNYHHEEEFHRLDHYQTQMHNRNMNYYHNLEKIHQTQMDQGVYSGMNVGSTNTIHDDAGLTSDSASDNEGYDDVNRKGHGIMDVSRTSSSSGRKGGNSLMFKYSVTPNADQVSHQAQKDPPVSAASASRKILNISVNVNAWKPPHYQPQSDATELGIQRSVQQNEPGASKSSLWFMKEKNDSLILNGNGKAADPTSNETQKTASLGPGSGSAGHHLEDPDSRTIFVNNVHFGATKDSLTRHFNKFGEVLKVVILTDAATGQPKGSAYVEFTCKEAAINALSLDGTSFMSRILKVVKKSSSQETSPAAVTQQPRVSRASPFAAGRFSRPPGSRVFPVAYRARPPVKLGARSMQWKRGAAQPTTMLDNVSAIGSNTAPSNAGRGLTYIRTEKTTPTTSVATQIWP